MKIIELDLENFKRLNVKAVMDGKSVTVEGKNGAGKSSFIDAIWVALTGKDVPGKPIQDGKESAEIVVKVKDDAGNVFVVEKKFLPSGVRLTVKTKDGAKYASPQSFLDQTFGQISFDPQEFVRKPPREQKKFLMDLLKIDFTEIENNKKTLLNEKDSLSKEYKYLKSELEKLPTLPDEIELKDKSEAIEKFKECIQKKSENQEKKRERDELSSKVLKLKNKIQELSEELERSSINLSKMNQESFVDPETTDIESEIKEIEINNEMFRKKELYKEKEKQLSSILQKGKEALKKIAKLEEDRIQIIASAKMPIDGLTFGEDGLIFDGLPFTEEQLSTSKIIEIGARISMALNPTLRIMRIKEGSLLDKSTLEIIKAVVKEKDYQLFMEKVSEKGEIGFVIEEN